MPEPTRASDYADKIAADIAANANEQITHEDFRVLLARAAREGYKLAMGLAVNA